MGQPDFVLIDFFFVFSWCIIFPVHIAFFWFWVAAPQCPLKEWINVCVCALVGCVCVCVCARVSRRVVCVRGGIPISRSGVMMPH